MPKLLQQNSNDDAEKIPGGRDDLVRTPLQDMWRLGFLPDEKTFSSEDLAAINKLIALDATIAKQEGGTKLGRSTHKRDARTRKRRERLQQKARARRYQRHLLWYQRGLHAISYLGAGVSGTLNEHHENSSRLRKQGLPLIEKASSLAAMMGINIAELRFLAFSRRTSKIRHYRQFQLVKKSGGLRRIAAPMPRLKRIQYWILDNILNKLPVHPAAHGFVKDRSICTNALPHVGATLLINADLKDFFPSITFTRVRGLFHHLGYSKEIATILALLCTEFDFEQVQTPGGVYFVGHGERKLPQGSPASPAISNLICKQLDIRLSGLAAKRHYVYTRYADDLTFSTKAQPAQNWQKLFWACRQILQDEGFTLHKDKTKVLRKHVQQQVTGIVVNKKMSLDRKTRRRLRAATYTIAHNAGENLHWNGKQGVTALNAMRGYAHYLCMVDKKKGTNALMLLEKAAKKLPAPEMKPVVAPSLLSPAKFRQRAALGEPPREPWWQAPVSKAPEPPADVLDLLALDQLLAAKQSAVEILVVETQPIPKRRRSGLLTLAVVVILVISTLLYLFRT